MKLSFTTLACPSWDLDTIVRQAVHCGYDGVDFRGLQGTMNVFELPAFTSEWNKTARLLLTAQLQISCFSSSVQLISREKLEQHLEEVRAYAALCERFQTKKWHPEIQEPEVALPQYVSYMNKLKTQIS
ncbi:hypothetical protein DUZ99_17470 [Xylanibacillus composti]|uniref:Sugar phosphate isomerase/epimerase n=1 Tax=Xylanibacillus composti TaxID=1572762 RepID=A0A8J4H242_9BACL|nr:hypothetical protein [Xylanibacillus composti]MDT9726770.1 hypothetical protein [Xylanibacillus composti]GIQ67248.1 sugar phosphate isomerase/epimerase [Xylanibacillus composti]